MKHLKIVIERDDVQTTIVSDYIASFFSGEGWIVNKVHLDIDPSFLKTPTISVADTTSDDFVRCLSFTPNYTPKNNEKVVFWLLTNIYHITGKTQDPFLEANPFMLRQMYFRNLACGTVFTSDTLIRDDLLPHIKSTILQLPPFIISKVIPGPYKENIVIDVDSESDGIVAGLVKWLENLVIERQLSIYLKGLSDSHFKQIIKTKKRSAIQITMLSTDDELKDTMRNCLCYVAIGIADDLLKERTELAAALLRPIVIVGENEISLDIFVNEITGFRLNNMRQFATVMDLFLSRRIDAVRMGEFAFRTFLTKRNPEKTLMECLK